MASPKPIEMSKGKVKKKHLLRLGYEAGPVIKIALQSMMQEHFADKGREFKLGVLQAVLQKPEDYLKHNLLKDIARALLPEEEVKDAPEFPQLREESLDYKVYGPKGIEQGAINQIEIASKLPVAVGAALMPDAHQGYGLPIGGVLAVENAVIPYGVGVDIGCRMCLTVYDLPENYTQRYKTELKGHLLQNSVFGAGKGFDKPMEDAVLERKEFEEIGIVKQLKDKAWKQIGSSGGGNHFVEFGTVEITDVDNEFGVKTGTYIGLLTHSGSRGMGAGIANYYTKVAMQTTRLPKEAKHLAWLNLDTEAGMEYWLAMNLAGDYASACHHHIHKRMAKSMGEKPLFMVENHHNFAWKEEVDGKELIVHRKGATPAGKGVLGIIPGSLTLPGFIVRGKGSLASLNSASHGAGRVMSRTKAKSRFTRKDVKQVLGKHGVTLIGGGVDEAPMVYKDIHQVMADQQDLVEVIGTFQPKIARMADD